MRCKFCIPDINTCFKVFDAEAWERMIDAPASNTIDRITQLDLKSTTILRDLDQCKDKYSLWIEVDIKYTTNKESTF